MSNTILHVDADQTTITLIDSILKDMVDKEGLVVNHETSGHAAIETLKGQALPDLVIVGEELDDLDGIGWIIQLRKVKPKLKAIYVTKEWPTKELYGSLTKHLKVTLVVVRPIKAAIFLPQIKAILNEEQPDASLALQPEALHNRAMEELRGKYVKALPHRLNSLICAIEQAKKEPSSTKTLDEAIRLSHNLKGTSGSCGFANLAEAGEHLEQALKTMKDNDLAKNQAAWSEINHFLRYVEHSVVQIAPSIRERVEHRSEDSGYSEQSESKEVGARSGSNASEASQILDNTTSGITRECVERVDSDHVHRDAGENQKPTPHPASVLGNQEDIEIARSRESASDPASIRVLVMSTEIPLDLSRELDDIPVRLIGTTSPEEAMSAAEELALDAALIDIDSKAPEPGITLARNLRSIPGNETLPVAFVSTMSQPDDLIASTHAGASLCLEKPLRRQILANAVDYLLSVRSGGRARVLIVDDDEDFIKMVGAILSSQGIIVKGLMEPERVVDTIRRFSPDVVLLDVMMPGTSGYETCQKIRSYKQWQDLPILFVTGETGLSARLAAFESGGDDYLPKPVAAPEPSLRVSVRRERARMLRERADKDVLSGLMIRRAFMEQLEALMSESRNNNLKFSLALLDLDHFKKINDTYGHLAGDEVLSHFGQLLRKRFRVEDLRGRWGGEEFIVAFRHIEKSTARGALQRCLEELHASTFEGENDQNFKVSFSAGLVGFPEDGKTNQELIKLADEFLYEAKRKGRNQICAEILEETRASIEHG